MVFRVRDVLPYGKSAAIAAKPLASSLGFRSVRELQKQIERERSAGAVILSTTQNGGGYFLSNDPNELRRFTRTLEARARNTIKSAESANKALDEAIGQILMEGWYGKG